MPTHFKIVIEHKMIFFIRVVDKNKFTIKKYINKLIKIRVKSFLSCRSINISDIANISNQ